MAALAALSERLTKNDFTSIPIMYVMSWLARSVLVGAARFWCGGAGHGTESWGRGGEGGWRGDEGEEGKEGEVRGKRMGVYAYGYPK